MMTVDGYGCRGDCALLARRWRGPASFRQNNHMEAVIQPAASMFLKRAGD
ncbi:hypothetical protein KCP69_00860 [Salmonella enterica subsp. enterica]|nr:hypothetical protein KCP69_00860 [Salmonella enterica subsp. enterica]